MEYRSEAKNIRISPRKVRLVVSSIKKQNLGLAITNLKAMKKQAAGPILKAIQSAVANASNNFKVKQDDLKIKNILAEEGISYKRHHYAARGRIRPYKRRSSSIKIILSDNKKVES